MAVEVRVPALGESVLEATVGRWLKAEGDAVAVGDPLVELETEKVAVEVAAESAGVLERIMHREGDTVHVGDVLAALADGGRAAATTAPAPQPAAAPAPPAESRQSAAPPAEEAAQEPPIGGASTPSSPSARRLAAERGLDLAQVAGSGPGGRITREDVTAQSGGEKSPAAARAVAPSVSQVAQAAASSSAPTPAPAPPTAAPATAAAATPPAGNGREERVRLSRRRLTIARRLVEAQQTAAILSTFNEVDMSAVMALRQRRREAFKERHGVSLGFMSFFTTATVAALKAFPQLNAELRGDELIVKHYYDIGIAVSTDEGLVVPVVRDADRKSFVEIEREINALAQRARENRLTLDELMGGTFTITNGGVFGSLLSTPILNPPQVGILGMHKIQERPVAVKGQVEVHPMMYVALSYDHRVVDGREAVQFLVRLKELIEDPETLLLEG
jgi:2-oxoglutarate dehydrogenase E2 component (dihydrolipoamide succinyltransferase)